MVPFKLEAQVSSSEAAFTPWKPNPCCNSLMEVFKRTSCYLIDFFLLCFSLVNGEREGHSEPCSKEILNCRSSELFDELRC